MVSLKRIDDGALRAGSAPSSTRRSRLAGRLIPPKALGSPR